MRPGISGESGFFQSGTAAEQSLGIADHIKRGRKLDRFEGCAVFKDIAADIVTCRLIITFKHYGRKHTATAEAIVAESIVVRRTVRRGHSPCSNIVGNRDRLKRRTVLKCRFSETEGFRQEPAARRFKRDRRQGSAAFETRFSDARRYRRNITVGIVAFYISEAARQFDRFERRTAAERIFYELQSGGTTRLKRYFRKVGATVKGRFVNLRHIFADRDLLDGTARKRRFSDIRYTAEHLHFRQIGSIGEQIFRNFGDSRRERHFAYLAVLEYARSDCRNAFGNDIFSRQRSRHRKKRLHLAVIQHAPFVKHIRRALLFEREIEFGATGEGIVADLGDRTHNPDIRQFCAVAECRSPDTGDTADQLHRSQIYTSFKRRLTDADHVAGDRNILQSGTAVESISADIRNGVGNFHRRQRGATRKCVVGNFRKSHRKLYNFERRAVLEDIIADRV